MPPSVVVPNRLPEESISSGAAGISPSWQLCTAQKEYSTLNFPANASPGAKTISATATAAGKLYRRCSFQFLGARTASPLFAAALIVAHFRAQRVVRQPPRANAQESSRPPFRNGQADFTGTALSGNSWRNRAPIDPPISEFDTAR